jgi:hypothetical protein
MVPVKESATLGTLTSKHRVPIQQFQLLLSCPLLLWLQNQLTIVVAGSFWFPQFLIGFQFIGIAVRFVISLLSQTQKIPELLAFGFGVRAKI